MKLGYARVSTSEQNPDLQIDALKKQGCRKMFVEKASGSKTERVELNKLLEHARKGDVIVIWKLDRLGRSLKHLVEVVTGLIEKGIGLKSLHDPVDTTTSQGRLVFNIFASLAEFERDVIRERTMAGLTAARARGRTGGRPKGMSKEAEKKALAAESLYKQGKLGANEIADNLSISKATLYKYLRHRQVEIGPYQKTAEKPQVMKIRLWLEVRRNSKFVRGMKKSREEIEDDVLSGYGMKRLRKDANEYDLTIPYQNAQELEETIDEIFREAGSIADNRNCFLEGDAHCLDDPERTWMI